MAVITVSKMRDNLSNTLSLVSDNEAISIQKNNKDVAVLVGSQRYKDLIRIEDLIYKKAADIAFDEGFASDNEVNTLMSKLDSRA